MSDIIQYITNGCDEFTPSVLISLIVFLCVLDSICNLISAIIRGVTKR